MAWADHLLAGHCGAIVRIQLEAMDFFSDTQETASRFGDYIDDLHDVFRCNGIDFGSPEDFFAFARTVKYHSELRGDVLRVVKSVMESEMNISFRTILTVIAVASGGPDVATCHREMSIPIKLVIESLIGVGACRQLNGDHPVGLYSDLTVTETSRAVAQDPFAQDNLSSDGGEATAIAEAKEPMAVLVMDGSSADSSPFNSNTNGFAEVLAPMEAEDARFDRTADDSSIDQSLLSEGLPSQESLSNGDTDPTSGHRGLLNGHGGSNKMAESTLAESLTRLELNSLQLKIYLDSIDQRISRMEPRLENVVSIGRSTAPLHTKEEETARFSTIVPSAVSVETIPAETISAVATEPQLIRNDPHVLNERDRAANAGGAATGSATMLTRLRTGWQELYSSQRQGVLPTLAGVAMVLVVTALFWSFGRDTGYAVVDPVNASMTGAADTAGISATPRTASSVGDRSVGGTGESQVAGVSDAAAVPGDHARWRGSQGGNSTSAYNETTRGVNYPVDAPISPSKTPARTSLPSGPPLSGSPSSQSLVAMSSPEGATDKSEVAPLPVRTYKLSSAPSSNHLVNVSSGVMAANLVSSPKPSYPTLASITRTQGNVVMQAVISKSGTVEHLHVIEGHRLLRGAAKSAVRNWRYRPYKIGGVPVEVATIVSVDFSLHR
jgi:TonB family protein